MLALKGNSEVKSIIGATFSFRSHETSTLQTIRAINFSILTDKYCG